MAAFRVGPLVTAYGATLVNLLVNIIECIAIAGTFAIAWRASHHSKRAKESSEAVEKQVEQVQESLNEVTNGNGQEHS